MPALKLSDKMERTLRKFVEIYESRKGEYPKGHDNLVDLGIGVYCSDENIEKELGGHKYFMIKALNIEVNYTGEVNAGFKNIDNYRFIDIHKFIDAVFSCLKKQVAIGTKYKREDFFVSEGEIVEHVTEVEIENEEQKQKAAILDKLLNRNVHFDG